MFIALFALYVLFCSQEAASVLAPHLYVFLFGETVHSPLEALALESHKVNI